MRVILNYSDIVKERPLEGGIVYATTGTEVGSSGLYGPTVRTTYTYESYRYDLRAVIDSITPGVQYTINTPTLGEIHLNEWLRSRWLCPMRLPRSKVLLGRVGVKWSSTMAWCEAGSWGRVTLNVRYRQAGGLVCARNFHSARDSLITELRSEFPDIEVVKPEELWDCRGVPPDLLLRRDGYEFTEYIGTGEVYSGIGTGISG